MQLNIVCAIKYTLSFHIIIKRKIRTLFCHFSKVPLQAIVLSPSFARFSSGIA